MKAPRSPVPVRFMLMFGALLLGISSCRFMPSAPPHGMRTLPLPPTRASVLVIIADPDSPSAMRATGALVEASARPAEQVVILSSQGATTLASSKAPASPSLRVPGPPVSLPPHPTSFQKARYSQAVRQYQNMIIHARATLRRQQQQGLAKWARSLIAKAQARPVLQRTQAVNIETDLAVAASDLSSMRQAGLGYGPGTVIAIMGVSLVAARLTPASLSGLQGSTVLVDDFPGTTDEQAAWQASLVQGGAARTVVLTPGTDNQLLSVVRQGLDDAVTDTLTSVSFGLGQYKLRTAALPQLRKLLYLLTVTYPRATVSIDGYTDNLPVPGPGGNLQLSRLRAREVGQWLVAHGIAASRVEAFGYGDSDPLVPNTPNGQPLNRRVVVVIDPAVSA
jgi:outer membrane protein OmpA-like peptidoglycan-associated protein